MTREEKIKLIKGFSAHLANKGGLVASNYDEEVINYLDSLEMTKEKAITWLTEMTNGCKEDSSPNKEISKALQFAIDYMKDEGDIIGWVNYYPILATIGVGRDGEMYPSKNEAFESSLKKRRNSVQIPIRKPK